jgi:hypothetical protein
MMKYRGSTSGAVMSERAVARIQMMKNAVVGLSSAFAVPALWLFSWMRRWISVFPPILFDGGACSDVGGDEKGVQSVR